ncbi:hypothetical protein MHBO_001646 [Bonamia ostreae]|uniref:FAD/NAD(P)-binding domain-containing protein n=1 Tax=Bonamia ostreae TaxID=126728 RepID=A0ABV2AJN8_9EUKA
MRKFDLLVIGGGSGGVACSRRAASYGKKVALFEYKRLGGTCVNVGCVPKKVMYNSAEIHNAIKIAPEYGFDVKIPTLNYSVLKRKRDAYVERLNGIYSRLLNNSNVEVISQKATFKENKVVVAGGLEYTAPVIVIAAGGEPNTLNIPGKEYAINSDDFFNKMDKVPKKIAIIGGGYIGNEIACVLNSLGSQVTVIYRGDKILRGFDEMLRNSLIESMTANGIKIKLNTNLSKITKNDHFLDIETTKGDIFKRFDQVLFAVGRHSVADQLGLSNTALKLNNKNEFETDEWEETNVKGVYALGDINGKIQLTPVAISAGSPFLKF